MRGQIYIQTLFLKINNYLKGRRQKLTRSSRLHLNCTIYSHDIERTIMTAAL